MVNNYLSIDLYLQFRIDVFNYSNTIIHPGKLNKLACVDYGNKNNDHIISLIIITTDSDIYDFNFCIVNNKYNKTCYLCDVYDFYNCYFNNNGLDDEIDINNNGTFIFYANEKNTTASIWYFILYRKTIIILLILSIILCSILHFDEFVWVSLGEKT